MNKSDLVKVRQFEYRSRIERCLRRVVDIIIIVLSSMLEIRYTSASFGLGFIIMKMQCIRTNLYSREVLQA